MLLHQNLKSCLFFAFRLVSFVPHGVQLIELKPLTNFTIDAKKYLFVKTKARLS